MKEEEKDIIKIHSKEENFDELLRKALLSLEEKDMEAEAQDLPPMPDSLSDRISRLIAEDAEVNGTSKDEIKDDAPAETGFGGAQKDPGNIISIFGRRIRKKSLANAAALVAVAGIALYGAGVLREGSTSGSTAEVADMAVAARAYSAEETAAASEYDMEAQADAYSIEAAAAPEEGLEGAAATYELEGDAGAETEGYTAAAQNRMYKADMAESSTDTEALQEATGSTDVPDMEVSAASSAAIPNPMQEVTGASDIEEQLGISMKLYDEALEPSFYIISGDLGQISYRLTDGSECTYRGSALLDGDISGFYGELHDKEETELSGIIVSIGSTASAEGDNIILMSWSLGDTAYSLMIEGQADRSEAVQEAERLIALLMG